MWLNEELFNFILYCSLESLSVSFTVKIFLIKLGFNSIKRIVLQIEIALTNDYLRVSNLSRKFCIIYNFAVIYSSMFCSYLAQKSAYTLFRNKVSILKITYLHIHIFFTLLITPPPPSIPLKEVYKHPTYKFFYDTQNLN